MDVLKGISEHRRGFAALVLASATYASWGVLSRIIGSSIPLLYQNTFRSLLAVIVYVTVLHVRPGVLLMPGRDLAWVIARTVFGLLGIVSFVYGIRILPFGSFYFIFYAGQALTGYLLGRLFFSEKITPVKIISFTLAVSGLSILYKMEFTGVDTGSFAVALICGASTTAWNILSKKISGKYSAFELGFADNFWGIVLGLTASAVLGERFPVPAVNAAWITNTFFGLTTVATGALIVYGFKRTEATVGSIVMLTEVLFGVGFGFFLYGEHINYQTAIGGLSVLTAVILPEIAVRGRGTIRSKQSV